MKKLLTLCSIALSLALTLPDLSHAQNSPFPFFISANMQMAATANGNGVSLDTSKAATAVLQATGGFGGGTLNFEGSNDGVNWTSLFCWTMRAAPPSLTTTNDAVATITTAGLVRCNVAGVMLMRARLSAATGASLTVVGMSTSSLNSPGTGN